MKSFEVIYRASVANEVIECEKITFINGWVTFTSKGYLHMAYPADMVHGVFELDRPDEEPRPEEKPTSGVRLDEFLNLSEEPDRVRE